MATPRYRERPLPGAPVTVTHTIVLSYDLIYEPTQFTKNYVQDTIHSGVKGMCRRIQIANGGVDVDAIIE